MTEQRDGPHQDQPLRLAGAGLEEATAAAILVHGRGATAQSILDLRQEIDSDGHVAYLAPQAAGNTWYPHPFLAPIGYNEPGRSSGLQAIAEALETAAGADIPPDRSLILGFSQGACLASEFVARRPDRYGGLVALSGGLIGESVDPSEYEGEGELADTPAFFGCSTNDPHIPVERVEESAAVFEQLGADVEVRLYDGLGHTVNQDELDYVSALLESL